MEKLTGAEREAALSTRGGGNVSLISKEDLHNSVQTDVQTSLTSIPKGSPSLYDAKTLRTLYLRFHHEDWSEQNERILSHGYRGSGRSHRRWKGLSGGRCPLSRHLFLLHS